MARKGPKPRPPPVPKTPQNRRGNPAIVTEENPPPINPSINMDPTQLQAFMAQGIATALATYEASRNGNPEVSLSGSGTSIIHRSHPPVYTYKDFMSYKPRKFKGNEGVIGFNRWVEEMETVFSLSSCPDEFRVKYASCTLSDAAMTWWKDHVKTMGIGIAHNLEWKDFKQMLLDEYCPRQEIQNLEQELWDLKMKGSEVTAYTLRFNDLASLCPGMVDPEYKKIERYIWGLSPPVKGLVTASRPTSYDSAKQLAYKLTNQCVQDGIMTPQPEKKAEGSKRKFNGEERGESKHHKPQQEPVAVYAAINNSPAPLNSYQGDSPLCPQCGRHHRGECLFCTHCKIYGHTVKYCRRLATPTPAAGRSRACYECNQTGHFRKDCPKLKNQGGRGRVFRIGPGEAQRALDEDNDTLGDMLNL